jgi:energy coupling factor transporter S component ThiW
MLSLFVAIGVIISPILRIEGMCPTAHLVNIVCAVFLGPFYAFACAFSIGIIRMLLMGIPPLALTGAVFGAFLSGILYRASKGKLLFAVLGEIFGTGIIGSILSYPVMAFLWGYGDITLFYYTPMFLGATLMGGASAYILLKIFAANGTLIKIQQKLGGKTFEKQTRPDSLFGNRPSQR